MKLLSWNGSSSSTVTFIVLPLTFLVVTGFLVYRHEFDLQCFLTGCGDNSTAANFMGSVVVAEQEPSFRALVGILTKADLYERRQLMRHAYALQPKPRDAQIDVRFVLCNLTTEEQKVLVAMEIMLYGDIIILNCTENMNDGKTYTFFSSVVGMFNGTNSGGGGLPYDFVTKCDDDTYFRLANFADALRKAPRDDLYLGFLAPCDKPDAPYHFMAGMGYTISWDVAQWVATEEEVRKHKVGVEDILTSVWMSVGRKTKHWVDMNPRMYDYMDGPRECFRHEFLPDTIAVHRLKTNLRWARTLSYFNVTKGLKPSKLYHI